jgi:kinesin family protein 3/17
MLKPFSDLQSEFEKDRQDYLDTIRKQDQQLLLLQTILDKVQPTLRKDCNYR